MNTDYKVSEIWSKCIQWFEDTFLAQGTTGNLRFVVFTVFEPIEDVFATTIGIPDLPQWVQDLLLPFIGHLSIFDLMLGGGLVFMIGFTMVKWIIGIVTGS